MDKDSYRHDPPADSHCRYSLHCQKEAWSLEVRTLAFSAGVHGFDPRIMRGKISVSKHAFLSVICRDDTNKCAAVCIERNANLSKVRGGGAGQWLHDWFDGNVTNVLWSWTRCSRLVVHFYKKKKMNKGGWHGVSSAYLQKKRGTLIQHFFLDRKSVYLSWSDDVLVPSEAILCAFIVPFLFFHVNISRLRTVNSHGNLQCRIILTKIYSSNDILNLASWYKPKK